MDTIQTNIYRTKDIFEASWIYSQKAFLNGLEPDQAYFWFVFSDNSLCHELSNQYWSSEAVGNIKDYVNAFKTLKDLVFSKKDRHVK